MAYLRLGLWAAFVLGLVYAGWVANGWRLKAATAEGYRLELRNELERRVAADVARLKAQRELATAQARVVEKVKIVKQTVTKYVPQNAECDLNDIVAGQLQRLREGADMPPAPGGTAVASEAPRD
jgi:polyphosphate kinase